MWSGMASRILLNWRDAIPRPTEDNLCFDTTLLNMKALWLENNQMDIRDIPQPRKPNEALIKIRKAGICSTDLELVNGYYPYTGVLGHEFVGEIVSISDSFALSGA